MSKQNPYHVTIKNLETNVEKNFILQRPEKGFSITGSDTKAPKYISGAVSYGDFTNHSVFAQANWSGGSEYKYFNPEVVGYQVQSYSNKFYKQSGFDVQISPGELRLGASAVSMAGKFETNDIVKVVEVSKSILFVGTEGDSAKLWYSTDEGENFNKMFDSATKYGFSNYTEIHSIKYGSVDAKKGTDVTYRSLSNWYLGVWFVLKQPLTNNTRLVRIDPPTKYIKRNIGRYGEGPLTAYKDMTITSIKSALSISGNFNTDGVNDELRYRLNVTDWNGYSASDVYIGMKLSITGAFSDTMEVLGVNGANQIVVRDAAPNSGSSQAITASVTGTRMFEISEEPELAQIRKDYNGDSYSASNFGGEYMNHCTVENQRNGEKYFVEAACGDDGPDHYKWVRYSATSSYMTPSSTAYKFWNDVGENEGTNITNDTRRFLSVRGAAIANAQVGDVLKVDPLQYWQFTSYVTPECAIWDQNGSTWNNAIVMSGDSYLFTPDFPNDIFVDDDNPNGLDSDGYTSEYKAYKNHGTSYSYASTLLPVGNDLYVGTENNDGEYLCNFHRVHATPATDPIDKSDIGEKRISAIVEDNGTFFLGTNPRGRIYAYDDGSSTLSLSEQLALSETGSNNITDGVKYLGQPVFVDNVNGSLVSYNKINDVWSSLCTIKSDLDTNDEISELDIIGSKIYIGANFSESNLYQFDAEQISDSAWLMSSWYDAQMPAIDKKPLYVQVLTYPLENDTESLRMAVQLDFDTTWYYLPTTVGGSWSATPGAEHNIIYDVNKNLRAHEFYFPHTTPKWKKLRYKIEATKGVTFKPVIATIDVFYLLTEKKEILLPLTFPLNPRQELINRNVDVNKHQDKLAFLRDIWDNDSICEITYLDGLSYKAIPFKPDMLTGGGMSISYNNVEDKRFDDNEISYSVNMIFKTINLFN